MSLSSFITDIKSKIFGTPKKQIISKITPISDNQYFPDLEIGEGGFNIIADTDNDYYVDYKYVSFTDILDYIFE